MRLSIFGNTNNYPYTLALGFRSIGVEVGLVINRPEPLHRPEAKDPSLAGNYPDWIMDCSELGEEDFILESSRIGPVLHFLWHDSSGLLLNDLGPSLLHAVGLPGLSLLTGSDLTYYANYESERARISNWEPEYRASVGGRLARRKWREFVTRQRQGILSSSAVSSAFPGLVPEADALLRDISVPDEHRFFVYLADTVDLALAPPLLRNELRIFNGARLNWVKPLPEGYTSQDDKGTDILLSGFAQFLHAGGRGTLVLIEKGLHVAETRELANTLGIAGSIEWKKEMTVAAYHDEACAADVVCDQLGSSFPGLAALDAMAIGRPVIANFRMDLLAPHYPEPWPVCHVDSTEGVRDALLRMYQAKDVRDHLGREGRAFAERHLSPEANARKCLARLGLDAQGRQG